MVFIGGRNRFSLLAMAVWWEKFVLFSLNGGGLEGAWKVYSHVVGTAGLSNDCGIVSELTSVYHWRGRKVVRT
ncbi:hypothetical protein TNCV_3447431 [Trichonephila clavipes]|nr:hypothetical protein TNCV_3447431 [Trichonephila clavipes]